MRIFPNFPHELPDKPEFPVVTVGVFDGLHLGHQALLRRALEVARGDPVAVVTFDPHPRAVLGPPKRHRLLSPLEERLELLRAWPVAAVAVLRFDVAVARQSYMEFVQRVLVDGLGARHLVLGYNLRLGHERLGTPERVAALGRELGYALDVVPPVEVDGRIASSTVVRELLDAGDAAAAARHLGRPYAMAGTVVRGSGRGRALGIPTANLDMPPEKLVPASGVYAVEAEVGAERYLGALNIGTAPTFTSGATWVGGSPPRVVEVHLLDFDGDLYGANLRVGLRERLRDERRFPDGSALAAQVRADLAAVRRILADRRPPSVP